MRPARRAGRRGRSYASLADFYDGDARRLSSPERDVGLWWRDADGEPLHRAAWVEDTGELYIVRADDGEDGGGSVEVLARSRDWARLAGKPRRLAGRVRRARLARVAAPQLGSLGPPAGGAAASA